MYTYKPHAVYRYENVQFLSIKKLIKSSLHLNEWIVWHVIYISIKLTKHELKAKKNLKKAGRRVIRDIKETMLTVSWSLLKLEVDT